MGTLSPPIGNVTFLPDQVPGETGVDDLNLEMEAANGVKLEEAGSTYTNSATKLTTLCASARPTPAISVNSVTAFFMSVVVFGFLVLNSVYGGPTTKVRDQDLAPETGLLTKKPSPTAGVGGGTQSSPFQPLS